MRTGDAARVDDEAFVWIVDRVADAYQVQGGTVYPGDVERVLTEHPAVADVGVAFGQGTSRAFVVLEADQDADAHELLEFCRSRLAAHEVPSAIVFRDELPRSSVGKLVRHELR